MDFVTWFHAWLARHPLKEPSNAGRSAFTAQVMARVHRLHPEPSRVLARWVPTVIAAWPRLALASAALALLAVVAVSRIHRGQDHVATLAPGTLPEPVHMATLDRSESLPAARGAVAELPGQGQQEAGDMVQLAESGPDDGEWLEQTLLLLEQLDEEPPSHEAEASSDGVLDDLQLLDDFEVELAAKT